MRSIRVACVASCASRISWPRCVRTLSGQGETSFGADVGNIASEEAERSVPTSGGRRLWRMDEINPFTEVPQAWLTNLRSLEEKRLDLIELHPDVFRVAPRLDILHRNVNWQLVYRNLSLIKMLSRAEMPGGGRKPWPQKKTGRHHAGSIRASGFIRGGFAHGARGPRTWFYMLPDAIRLQGLCVALTIKHVQNDLVIVDDFESLPNSEPVYMRDLAETRNWGYSVLFVSDSADVSKNLVEVCEAIPSFNIMPVYGLNCYSLIKYDTIVLSKLALDILEYRIMFHKHRAETLQRKYCYKDYKDIILNEAEKEIDPVHAPYV